MRIFGRGLLAVLCVGALALAGCEKRTHSTAKPVAPTIPSKARFAYIGNQGGSLSGYSVNRSTGALTALRGFPLKVGSEPTTVAVDPQNRFLFVGEVSLGLLHVFAINSATGGLSEIGKSPFGTVWEPIAIAVDPLGKHVYVAGQGSNSVGGFNLSATGTLTPIAGSPFATSGTQNFGDAVVINAAGTMVYVQDISNIYAYTVSASSGALTLAQTVSGAPTLGSIVLDPLGIYLYAVGADNNSIQAYSINSSTGQLTLAKSSPLLEQAAAYTLSISPNGKFAYTIENNNYLVSYTVTNGIFTPVGNVYAQVYGLKIGIDPSGRFVYVPQACSQCPSGVYNVIHEFSIGRTGALTRMTGKPAAAGITPCGIAITTR
jgi:6-phosphogluconolactonase (cycloisomerase 2 family)